MTDKPTLKEFIRYRGGRYVMTEDGRYYVIRNNKALITFVIIPAVILLTGIALSLTLKLEWGDNIACDLMVVLQVFNILFYDLFCYRLARFSPIEQDSVSEKDQKALKTLIHKKDFWLVNIVLMSILAFMLSFSSYSLAYLRSLLDTPVAECRVSSAEMEKSITVYTEEDDRIIRLRPEPEGEVSVSLWVFHTPHSPQLMLDGAVVSTDDLSQYDSVWFEDDYFCQAVYYDLDAENIRDGSVLTLACGDWQYEWAFSIGDE